MGATTSSTALTSSWERDRIACRRAGFSSVSSSTCKSDTRRFRLFRENDLYHSKLYKIVPRSTNLNAAPSPQGAPENLAPVFAIRLADNLKIEINIFDDSADIKTIKLVYPRRCYLMANVP
jgi:hypothetical protein